MALLKWATIGPHAHELIEKSGLTAGLLARQEIGACPPAGPAHARAVGSRTSGRRRRAAELEVRARSFVQQRREHAVVRREHADGIGASGVAGQGEGLAAAAAEVVFAPVAGAARLGHPVEAAEPVERRRPRPDLRESNDRARRGTRIPEGSRRRDRAAPCRPASPAATGGPSRPCRPWDARRSSLGRRNRSPAAPSARLRAASTVAVAASTCSGEGRSAARFRQRPAVVLDLRDLDAAGPELEPHGDHRRQPLQVLPVDDEIERQRETRLAHPLAAASLRAWPPA